MAKSIVVLDIGATHLTGIEAVPADVSKGKRPKILKIHRSPLPAGVLGSGNLISGDDLRDALKLFWKEAKFSSKNVVALATGEAYQSRVASNLRWAPDADFKKTLPYHLKNQKAITFDIEKFWLDSHTLDEYYNVADEEDNTLYKKVLVMGVQKDHLDKLFRALEGAGLRPLALDAIIFSLIRTYQMLPDAVQGAPVVSIDLGADVVTVVVHQDGQPISSFSTAPMGGADVTESMIDELGIAPAEAEMLKISYSLPPEVRKEQSVTFNDPDTKMARTTRLYSLSSDTIKAGAAIIAEKISNLNEVIISSLEDAFTGRRGELPAEIVLSGGHAHLYHLAERLGNQLNIPVRFAQPFTEAEMKKFPAGVSPSMLSTAYGLLLGQKD